MSFVCPRCDKATLSIVDAADLGPGDDDDERRLQRVRCDSCGLTGAALYRASRRGADEAWHHDGYLLDAAGEDALRLWFATPASERRTVDGIGDFALPTAAFPMRWAE